ncbi:MAG: ribosomal protein L7/L12, partial [Caldimonas sp.]
MRPSPANRSAQPLPADVLAALEQGQTIEAIKRLRAATGLGLKEAKDAIDRHVADGARPKRTVASMLTLPFAVAAAAKQGNKVEAIRLLRERGGLGPTEAKTAIDTFERENADGDRDSAPGEVRRISGAAWLVLIAVLAGLVLLA